MELIKVPLAVAGLANAARALGSRNFRTYVIGNGISQCGSWMQKVGVGWLAWELTHSGIWLGIIATADLAATLVCGPLAGALTDRFERLRLARLTQLVAMVQGLLLAALTAEGLLTIEGLFLLSLLMGAINSIDGPSRLALVPSLIERASLSSAVAINSIVFNGARFLGPLAAGLVIARSGVALAFALNAVSYLWFFAALLVVRLEPSERVARNRGLLRETVEGCVYSAKHPGIGPMLLLLVVNMVGLRSALELLPGFADAVFGQGAQGLAWLTAATGLGAMLAGLFLIWRGGSRGLPGLVVWSLLGSVIAIASFGATRAFWLGIAALLGAGFTQVAVGVSSQVLIQMAVDPAMRGRVMSLYGMINRGGPALGALLLGLLSAHFGLQWPVIGGAALTGLYWIRARRQVKQIAAALDGGPPQGPSHQ